MIGVRLPGDLEAKMNAYLKAKKITKSRFVKQVVEDFLRQQELREHHDHLAQEGLEEIKRGKGVPGEAVFKMLEEWGRGD